MSVWRPQAYRTKASALGMDEVLTENVIQTIQQLRQKTPSSAPIISLGHLSHSCGVDFGFLRSVTERTQSNAYRTFRIFKAQLKDEKKPRFRIISVPSPQLMAAQRWILEKVIGDIPVHEASVAYSKGDNITEAASRHCNSKWLIKLDIKNFFESITERSVYSVFHEIGYQPLVALELARICTKQNKKGNIDSDDRWGSLPFNYKSIQAYKSISQGHLPQGAPTSPMLANLTMRKFDKKVSDLAKKLNLRYTRYADDLTFSSNRNDFNRENARQFIREIHSITRHYAFEPNLTKTRVVPPGGRKIVLGLLVDGPEPRLTKKYRDNIDQHLHFLLRPDISIPDHATRSKSESIYGLKNHVRGLIAHAGQVDKKYAATAWEKFNRVAWP